MRCWLFGTIHSLQFSYQSPSDGYAAKRLRVAWVLQLGACVHSLRFFEPPSTICHQARGRSLTKPGHRSFRKFCLHSCLCPASPQARAPRVLTVHLQQLVHLSDHDPYWNILRDRTGPPLDLPRLLYFAMRLASGAE